MARFTYFEQGSRGITCFSSSPVPPSGISHPFIPLHVIINHKERSNIDNNDTGNPQRPQWQRMKFFQSKKKTWGSFNFKNHRKLTNPPPLPPTPCHNIRPETEYFSFCTKIPTPQKREREGTEGRGAKKKYGKSKSPQYSPETQRKRVREKNRSARKSFAISTAV